MDVRRLKNYVNGEWVESRSTTVLDVENPATAEVLAQVPISTKDEVDEAVRAAKAAFREWRETPPPTRARYMFRLKELMELNFEEMAETLVKENGKNIDEARGEVRRAIENVEVAAGIPTLMMGYNAEDVAPGIDEHALIVPVGVFACFAPFNFPIMIPFWFLPYALAAGDTYVVKPSSEVPLCMQRSFDLVHEAGFPPGVANLVNGGRDISNALMENTDVRGVSFVGSTKVGRLIYKKSAEYGKRVQVQGAAKNYLLVMEDAVLDRVIPNIMTSAYGCTGQRCLAGSVILAVGNIYEPLKKGLLGAARQLKVGYGLDETVQMGPLASKDKMEIVVCWIERGVKEGGKLILDGRKVKVPGYEKGCFVGPTLFDEIRPEMEIANEEVFGPVLGIVRVKDFEEAVQIIDRNPYGNAATIYTSSGRYGREFRYRVECGNIGINVGVAAPIAYFPFGGMRQSFFGDLHGQGLDAIQFFTDRKVVVERWF